ncbi:MAG TPA: class I SAM-dependent methyltransferase [Bryobacteraceae bacterium]
MTGALRPGNRIEMFDLCSGAGGPIPMLLEELRRRGCEASVMLSDLYPSSKHPSYPGVSWASKPVDATHVPPDLNGVRTIFCAFHHFRPEAARAVLEDAFRHRRSICIFESGAGKLLGAATMLIVPLNVIAMMPFVRPFRFGYFLFTYLIPLLPLIVFWDGVVSMLRIYSPEQMKEFTADLQASDYVWEVGRLCVPRIPGGLPYLIGRCTCD